MTWSQEAELEKQGVGTGAWGREDGGGLPPEACREERRQARWPAGCIIPALRAVCDALAKCQARSKNPPVTPRSPCPHTPYSPTPPPRARSPPEFVSLHRRVCAAGIAGGAGGDLVVSSERAPSWGGPGALGTRANAGGWSRGLGVAP